MTQATGTAPARSDAGSLTPGSHETAAVIRHVAHELRQPLSTIEAIAYYLSMVLPRQDARARRQVEKLQQVIQQANWILSDAVHFLQASPPHPEVIDLDEFLSESVRETARGEKMWVHISLCPRPTLVRLDPDQARHLLRSTLLFFGQACKPDPRLWVRTSVVDSEVRIEFEGTGANRTVEELESMFDPFSAHLPASSGLALASVRRITETHGGRIEFHSGEGGRLSLVIGLPEAG